MWVIESLTGISLHTTSRAKAHHTHQTSKNESGVYRLYRGRQWERSQQQDKQPSLLLVAAIRQIKEVFT
jgi:hypothetical protein